MWRKLIGSWFLHGNLSTGDLKKQDVPRVARPMKMDKMPCWQLILEADPGDVGDAGEKAVSMLQFGQGGLKSSPIPGEVKLVSPNVKLTI